VETGGFGGAARKGLPPPPACFFEAALYAAAPFGARVLDSMRPGAGRAVPIGIDITVDIDTS